MEQLFELYQIRVLNFRQDSRPFTPDGEDKSVGLVDLGIYKHSYASSVSLSHFFVPWGLY